MKNYVSSLIVFLYLLTPGAAAGQELIPDNVSSLVDIPALELKIEPAAQDSSHYLPLWLVDANAMNTMRKFIWIASEDGKDRVLEASNLAILRLAWNLDSYLHENKTTTN